jgi:hypothetical protein
MTRVIIAGSRHFDNYELLKDKCDLYLSSITEPIEVVSGRCNTGVHTFTTDGNIKVFGADGLGEKYAKEKGYSVAPFPADWKSYGNYAGPIRNKLMAQYAAGNFLIAFVANDSKGTVGMIALAKEQNLKVRAVYYEKIQN